MERAKPKFERLRTIYLNTLEAMKTNPQAYCRGLAPSPDVSAGEIDQLKARADAALNNITFTLSYEEAARDCDLVIEAIAENPDEKIAFYTELAKLLPKKTIIATNSSTMLPSAFAQHTGRPEKYLALHFANEIWRNNTAGVMGHPETSKQAYDDVAEFAETISMIPLKLQKEQPGYILQQPACPLPLRSGSAAGNRRRGLRNHRQDVDARHRRPVRAVPHPGHRRPYNRIQHRHHGSTLQRSQYRPR